MFMSLWGKKGHIKIENQDKEMPKSVRRLEFKMHYYRGETISWLSELESTNLLKKTGANSDNVRQ